MINLKKQDPVADAVKSILQQEALKGNQHEIDKNKNNKIDAHDFKILRGEKKEVKKEEVEIVYEANIQPTSAKSRSHIGNLSHSTVNSVEHSGKQIGLITKQSDGTHHAMHTAAKLAHAESGTFDSAEKAHQFIRNAHAKAIKNKTLKPQFTEEVESVEEGMQQTLRKIVPGYAKKQIDKKMDDQKFGRTDVDKDANYYRYKKIQDKLKKEELEEGIGDVVKKFGNTLKKGVKAVDRVVTGGDKEDLIKLTQKQAGVEQTGKKPVQKEEVEQIDELSKSTLGSYAKKASHDATISRKIGADFEHSANRSRNPGMKAAANSLADKYKSKSWKRKDGVNKAVDRLTKEDVEGVKLKTLSQFRENAFDWKKKPEPTPNGGSGVKQGSRYGGSKQKDKPEQESDSKK